MKSPEMPPPIPGDSPERKAWEDAKKQELDQKESSINESIENFRDKEKNLRKEIDETRRELKRMLKEMTEKEDELLEVTKHIGEDKRKLELAKASIELQRFDFAYKIGDKDEIRKQAEKLVDAIDMSRWTHVDDYVEARAEDFLGAWSRGDIKPLNGWDYDEKTKKSTPRYFGPLDSVELDNFGELSRLATGGCLQVEYGEEGEITCLACTEGNELDECGLKAWTSTEWEEREKEERRDYGSGVMFS